MAVLASGWTDARQCRGIDGLCRYGGLERRHVGHGLHRRGAAGRRYRYDERLFLGTLAAGGTLGILIPPSINLIIFGFLTNTSIPDLYLAGFIPGLVLGGLFMPTSCA